MKDWGFYADDDCIAFHYQGTDTCKWKRIDGSLETGCGVHNDEVLGMLGDECDYCPRCGKEIERE